MTGVACVVANIETRAWIRVLFGHASLPIVCESKCGNIVPSRTWEKLLHRLSEEERSNNQKYLSSFSDSLEKFRETFIKTIDKEILLVERLKRNLSE